MGGVWGSHYEDHVSRLLMTLTTFRQMHEDPKFWWRVRARFIARVKIDADLTHDTLAATVSDNMDLEGPEPFTVHGPLWHMVHAIFETINMDLEMPGYEHFERMPETAYPTVRQGYYAAETGVPTQEVYEQHALNADKLQEIIALVNAYETGESCFETALNVIQRVRDLADGSYPIDPEAVEKGWPQGAALNAEMLAKALWKTGRFHDSALPEKFEDLDEKQQRWLTQSAEEVLQHLAAQRPDAIQYAKPKTEGEIGFDRYAALVAEVYGIEGQQIKPNDPRLELPDNRCPMCVGTMNEPQLLTPVRRQVHEKLQTGWHLPDCSTHIARGVEEDPHKFPTGSSGSVPGDDS